MKKWFYLLTVENNLLDTVQATVNLPQATDVRNPGKNSQWKGRGCSWYVSRVQIKDSGLTQRVDEETSPFLAIKVSFNVHSKK